jgi:dTDP-4-amino-4,6-dideoxygalactose transaminase
MISANDPNEVIRKRRENYLLLESLLIQCSGITSLFPRLADGVVPLCFPARVPDRAAVISGLQKCGIRPYVFGAFSHPLLPMYQRRRTAWMRETIIGLPVHQQMQTEQIAYLAESVLKVSAQCESRTLMSMKADYVDQNH